VPSGEINTKVADAQAVMARIRSAYATQDVQIDDLDGLTISSDNWWFNVRPSNTEPLLRLNCEGNSSEIMQQIRDEVLALMALAG
jgi:phosphomannomutase